MLYCGYHTLVQGLPSPPTASRPLYPSGLSLIVGGGRARCCRLPPMFESVRIKLISYFPEPFPKLRLGVGQIQLLLYPIPRSVFRRHHSRR